MIKTINFSTIPGVMLGFEWDYDNKFVVLDLLIFRVVFDYLGVNVVRPTA